MTEQTVTARPCATPFDASAWLNAWSDQGGIVMLVDDRLWLSRLAMIDRGSAVALDTLQGHLHRPGAKDALTKLLQARTTAFG
ncbi:hypothetical protein [Sphingomonas adhaesiva]|uniref:hypothetical protein n=1 Tax=Sphingomonas adhaesiva TaxID=28212 RepID=UPI002FFBD909